MQFAHVYKHSCMYRVLCLLVVLAVLPWACAESTEDPFSKALYPVREGNLWGYMDYVGNVIIQPQWPECGRFRGGKYALVSYGWEQDGIINIQGEYVFEPNYTIDEYSQHSYYGGKDTGVYWFYDNNSMAFFDINSGYFSDFVFGQYQDPWPESDMPYIKVTYDGETFGYMNRTNGELVIPCIFADMTTGEIHDGFVCDRIYGTDQVIVMNTEGKQLKLPSQVAIEEGTGARFANGRLLVYDRGTGLYGYCDTNGKLIIPATYEDACQFNEGYGAVKINGKWTHIDTEGNMQCEPKFNSWYHFLNKRAIVNDGMNITVIDYQGNVIRTFSSTSQDMPDYTQYGITIYTDYSQLWIIDLDGNEVGNVYTYDSENYADYKYSDYQFTEGIQRFIQNGKYGFVDYKGNVVSNLVWDYGENFSNGLAYVEKAGKMAYINTEGLVVWSEN